MKKTVLLVAVALLASLVLSTAALAEKKPEFTLKLGHLANTENDIHGTRGPSSLPNLLRKRPAAELSSRFSPTSSSEKKWK